MTEQQQPVRWGWIAATLILMALGGITAGWMGVFAWFILTMSVFWLVELATGGPKVKQQQQMEIWWWGDDGYYQKDPTAPQDEHPIIEGKIARKVVK